MSDLVFPGAVLPARTVALHRVVVLLPQHGLGPHTGPAHHQVGQEEHLVCQLLLLLHCTYYLLYYYYTFSHLKLLIMNCEC